MSVERHNSIESTYLIVLITPRVIRAHSRYEVEDVDECPVRIRISPQGKVAETDVVVGGDVACGYSSEVSLESKFRSLGLSEAIKMNIPSV